MSSPINPVIFEPTADIYLFNTTSQQWEPQNATCDTVLNECSLNVTHFSDFIVGGFENSIEGLISLTKSFNLKQGISNSLDVKLQNAKDALEAKNAGKRQDAVNKLEAFKNEAEAQRNKALTDEQSNLLIAMTNNVIAQI